MSRLLLEFIFQEATAAVLEGGRWFKGSIGSRVQMADVDKRTFQVPGRRFQVCVRTSPSWKIRLSASSGGFPEGRRTAVASYRLASSKLPGRRIVG